MDAAPEAEPPPYLIEGALPDAGLGTRFRGRHRVTHTAAAVTLCTAGRHGTPEELAALRDRALAARDLSHEHLVHVSAVWTSPRAAGEPGSAVPLQSVWIAHERIEGPSLADEVARGGALTWWFVADLAQQVADALAAAHARGSLHLAVRPEAIVRDEQGRARLADLGLGRARCITPFAAPEQTTGGPVGPATDVWGLGATIHALIAGAPPFEGADLPSLATAIRETPAPRLAKVAHECPPGLDEVVRGCLLADPERRYRSMDLLREDLARVLGGQKPRNRQTTRIMRLLGG